MTKPKANKLVVTEIRFNLVLHQWCWSHPFDLWQMHTNPGETKRQFVKRVVDKLHELHKETGRGFTLRIRTKAGTWQKGDGGEKTIPRSMDDKRSKG